MKKLIFFSLLAVLTFSIGCSQTSSAETTVDIDSQGPIIKFDVIEHDFGNLDYSGNGTFEFVFSNNGNEALVLSNVRSTCGCTVPQWPRNPIAPGENASINVKYDTKRVGAFTKSIYVYSNGSSAPIILKIKGKVGPRPAAE
jgi:hypothetical protein